MDVICGKVFFFGIDSAGILSLVSAKNQRIRAVNLPQSVNSGALFLESRNFFSIPKQSKGTLVAFQRLSKENTIWKLGIVNCIDCISQICELFVWNGPVINHSISVNVKIPFTQSFIFGRWMN